MLRPLAMKQVLLQVLTDDLPQVSLTLSGLGNFHPDCRDCDPEQFPEIPGERYRELHAEAQSRLEKIQAHVPLAGHLDPEDLRVIPEPELEQQNLWLGKVWARYSEFEEYLRQLAEQDHLVDELERALENFANLNMDLRLLQGEKPFIDLLLGIVPRSHLPRLTEAAQLAEHLVYTYLRSGDNAHVILVGPRGERENEIRSILDSAGFRQLEIPPQLQDEPDKVRHELAQRRQSIRDQRQSHYREMQQWSQGIEERLEQAQRTLLLAAPFVNLEAAARSTGYLSIVSGWVPAVEIPRLQKELSRALANPFVLSARDPRPDETREVPTALYRNRLLAPFSNLVKQYGIPRYREVDPSLLFALTFVLMFGMMFGDIGHGAVIVLAAWLGRGKLKDYTVFAMAAGASAMVFGALYGSIFGYEELLHPLWMAPLSDPILMLTLAFAWGVGFLVLVTLVSIYNRLVVGDRGGALFENNGVTSLALYLSLLWVGYGVYAEGDAGWPAVVLLLLSLAALLVYKWREIEAPTGERTLVVVVETFETITGYVSNSLSFLRVTAFSLNHVALAIAVFTLAETMAPTAHWITVVLGNLFILVLEGAIVTIQVLRLEYFEGFSRFFSGDGKEFRPLRLNLGSAT
jgi:V/A-type H+-transporting ATPase subunit I